MGLVALVHTAEGEALNQIDLDPKNLPPGLHIDTAEGTWHVGSNTFPIGIGVPCLRRGAGIIGGVYDLGIAQHRQQLKKDKNNLLRPIADVD